MGARIGRPGRNWRVVVYRAKRIVESYDTPVTLRQLFYRLVANGTLENTRSCYNALSSETAQARREGWFPRLADNTSRIERPSSWDSPDAALSALLDQYRRDHTEGQAYNVYLGNEKDGQVAQLKSWFGNDLGVPIVALGGYGSQGYFDVIKDAVASDPRPAVLLYAGDFDPSGEDIGRDFVARTDCWEEVRQIALTDGQVAEFDLSRNIVIKAERRAPAFCERYGLDCRPAGFTAKDVQKYEYQQIELDALDPNDLRALYQAGVDEFWDADAYQASLAQETTDRADLSRRIES